MTRAVIPRERANRDVDEAVDCHQRSVGEAIALSFIDELERTYGHLAQHPSSGTLRFAYELGLPGLRAWPMKKHPFVIFYVERADHIDIWRVQHGARDIPDSLRGSIPSG